MTLRSRAGDVRRKILSAVYRRPVALGKLGPVVTFTFDDFPRSALTVGAEILESFGARATYYVAMSLMNTANSLGEQFHEEDLFSLVGRGHELGSHTFSHLSARRAGPDVFIRDAEKGEAALRETLGHLSSGNFAYPYGDLTPGVKRKLGARLTSCRGTTGGLNGPDIDLNLLRANSLYGDIDHGEAAKRMILENERLGGWLIFYSHDVAARPSRFGCSPQLLKEVCSFAASRRARFMTVAGVMRELGQQPDVPLEGNLQAGNRTHSQLPMPYSDELHGDICG
jgi:peptidoglycan/xylan/chitin deacetylase (PgdA/CDA1 family)